MKQLLLWFAIIILVISCDVGSVKIGETDSFIKFFEEGFGTDVLQTPGDGGYICLGTFLIEPLRKEAETQLIKTDADGNVMWIQRFAGESAGNGIDDPVSPDINSIGIIAKDLKIIPAGGYIFIGDRINSQDISAMTLIITDSNGNLTQEIIPDFTTGMNLPVAGENTHGSAIAFHGDGNILVLGTFEDPNDPPRTKIVLIKMDLSGTIIWSQAYGVDGKNDVATNSLQVNTTSGDIFWAGSVETPGVASPTSFLKAYTAIDNSNALKNANNIDSTAFSRDFFGNGFQPTETGFVIVGTSTQDQLEIENDIYIVKVDALGSFVPGSYHRYSGPIEDETGRPNLTGDDNTGNDRGNSIVSTSDGGMVILGTLTNADATKGEDFYLIKTDVSGIPKWTKIIGGEGDENGGTIIETVDNSLVFFGTTTLGGVHRMTLVKTDKDGNIN